MAKKICVATFSQVVTCYRVWSTFLALLDYVSRAHEIEKFVRRPSVRPSVCGIDYL